MSSRRFPKSFKLNNYTWTAQPLSRKSINELVNLYNGPIDALGCCVKDKLTICISTDQHEQETPRTVLHEILHACFHNSHILDANKEEEVVCLLEERLTDLIKNNPKLIRYFQENF